MPRYLRWGHLFMVGQGCLILDYGIWTPRGSGSQEGAKYFDYKPRWCGPLPSKYVLNPFITLTSHTPLFIQWQESTFVEPQSGSPPLQRRESTTPSGVIVFCWGGPPSQNFQKRFRITRFHVITFPGTGTSWALFGELIV